MSSSRSKRILHVLKLDTHVHTSPGSRCSKMGIDSYLAAIEELAVPVACVTNHGDMNDYDELVRKAASRVVIIPGVEISSHDGDFIIFSTDIDFLRSLEAAQPLPERGSRADQTAVIWVHPFAGVTGGLGMGEDYLSRIAPAVDGIEVYNGNWPDDEASGFARLMADKYDLAELGGSDTHRRESLFRCWTELNDVKGPESLIQAIMKKQTKAIRSPRSLQ